MVYSCNLPANSLPHHISVVPELPEELCGDGLLVHDVVVARRGERLLNVRALRDVGERQQLASLLAAPLAVVGPIILVLCHVLCSTVQKQKYIYQIR